ncbi:MAG: response regulator [Ginsengibacter sp.]
MKKIILIYDDDEEILELCTAILYEYDFDVKTFSRCENIVEDIQSYHPNLILMDLWIPLIGGEKAIEIVKQNESTKKVPVLIFSANSNIKEISIKVNADGYIEKPFLINTFIETINSYIN